MEKALNELGLGLGYHDLRLDRTTEAWVTVGAALRSEVARSLDGIAQAVEHVGSSSVVGLLAKPIIDLAVGVSTLTRRLAVVRESLEAAGWIYRGDAGDEGGHVFVLESRPWFRVAHIHAVEHGGPQWCNYQRFRDLLRQSRRARDRYEAIKVQLVDDIGNDRKAYTDGKSDVVRSLLDEIAHES